jgi:hypothetical protein
MNCWLMLRLKKAESRTYWLIAEVEISHPDKLQTKVSRLLEEAEERPPTAPTTTDSINRHNRGVINKVVSYVLFNRAAPLLVMR